MIAIVRRKNMVSGLSNEVTNLCTFLYSMLILNLNNYFKDKEKRILVHCLFCHKVL